MNHLNHIEIKDTGQIGLYYLKKIWFYHLNAHLPNANNYAVKWNYTNAVFNVLGIGIEPTTTYLLEKRPSFEDFELWIKQHGRIDETLIAHFNAIVNKEVAVHLDSKEKIFSEAELKQWHTDGYIILKSAVPKEDCERAVKLIYDTLEAKPDDPDSWYKEHPLKKGIMVQLFNHPILDKTRLSEKIRIAFEQLWGRNDLIVSHDRVSFNPPETSFYLFQGPNLHWDISLKRPIPFGTQGLLYLADTKENQGAFTLVPGFHNKIDKWLSTLEQGVNPRAFKIVQEFPTKSISAQAGDFIIWNHCLPHGSSPNTYNKPRIVQYINYVPLEMEYQEEWI